MQIVTKHKHYGGLEKELCDAHLVAEDDQRITPEFAEIKRCFASTFSAFNEGDDYEFTPWHSNLRMLWVYLYSSRFYDKNFVSATLGIIEAYPDWFIQYECYNTDCESIGCCLMYKQSAVFDDRSEWLPYLDAIGG